MTTLSQDSQSAARARRRFRSALLRWYDANKRDLPWRRTRDPFRIWVSEIMLQQTRVAAVLDHYRRFFQQFPTVAALAKAREQHVLTAWSGLGYYRRARMLHRAAKELAHDRRGPIPKTSAELQELPGIGRYTAAAIASIAFREPVAVVDGNVKRVLARVFDIQTDVKSPAGTKELWALAANLVPPDDAAALARGIGSALQQNADGRAAALRLRERVRAAFSTDVMTDGVLAAYRDARARRHG